MNTLHSLTRRVHLLLKMAQPHQDTSHSRVILYNALTGEPLPGQQVGTPGTPGYLKRIYIPDNGRDNYAHTALSDQAT